MRAAGHVTRERIIAVAKREFARYGLAGARIDRIAGEAQASKERLYAYFGSKQELFAEVSRKWMTHTADDVALSGLDLPGYVGRLFDDYVAHPENARLQLWAELELTDPLADDDPRVVMARAKTAEVRRAQEIGLIDPVWRPTELLAMLTVIAREMALPEHHPQAAVHTTRTVAARREAAVEAARRLVRPQWS